MKLIEDEYRKKGYIYIAGVDEAGRGPLAGDVFAAAVILPPDLLIEGLNDSKKLSPKKRERLYDEITENALSWCVARASIDEIESLLDSLFTAGLMTAHQDITDRVSRLSCECEIYGLQFACSTLSAIAGELEKRRHTLQCNDSGLTREYCVLNSYVRILKNKMDIMKAESAFK
jgi:hypothetical protein